MPLPSDVPHLRSLLDNTVEVAGLLEIHTRLAGPGPGRKHDVQILHKSAVVLLVACWEAYVEDLVKHSLEYMIAHCKDHTVFPSGVLERVASRNAGPKAWSLAGDGWKGCLRDSMSEVLSRTIGALNTPKTAQVDELFEKALGLKKLSSGWHWKGRSAQQVSKAIDDLVALRGSIAHRVAAPRKVLKKDVTKALELINRMAARSSNELRAFIHKQCGKYPWSGITYLGMP